MRARRARPATDSRGVGKDNPKRLATLTGDHLVAADAATALALALRNVAIYPPEHPRVTAAATDFVSRLAAGLEERRPMTIGQRGEELWVDNLRLPAEDGQATWLLNRLRDAGLRGFTFEPTCTTEDIVEFALTLNQARTRTGQAFRSLWPDAHPRIRAHDLVFSGTFRESDGESGEPGAQSPDADAINLGPMDATAQKRRVAVLERLARDSRLEQQMTMLQGVCGHAGEMGHELDLFAAIADLLPAEVAAHPEVAAEKIVEILGVLERELPTALRDGERLDEGVLLRTALRVARKYFQTEAPALPVRHNLPSGRPGDEAITANLEDLARELAALPDGRKVRLPAAAELAATATKITRELFGIFLHTFVNTEREEVRTAARLHIVDHLRAMDLGLLACIAAYLQEPGTANAIPERQRAQLIAMMVEAGQAETVRNYGYVDADFVTRSFPHSLPIAAKVLMSRQSDVDQFQRGLQALAPMLAIGGADTAAQTGVLAGEEVVEALLRLGGKVALPLMPAIAEQCPAACLVRVVNYTARLDLPSPERAILSCLQPPEAIPRDYLAALFTAAIKGKFDATMRNRSEAVLHAYIVAGLEELPTATLVEAIANLRHVPSPQTEQLLVELSRRGRFRQFSAAARAVRKIARETLISIESGGQP